MSGTDLIRDFVNTKHILDGREELATPGGLGIWLAGQGLVEPGAQATAADLRHAVELREALRLLLLANNGVEADTAGAFAVLDGIACRARVGLRYGEAGSELVPAAPGIKGALGTIVAAVHGATADGSWAHLKACRARDCEWAFVDCAKNQSRAWCSMRSCGNREKARAFRERQRAAGPVRSSSR